jgi:hypothetical protein
MAEPQAVTTPPEAVPPVAAPGQEGQPPAAQIPQTWDAVLETLAPEAKTLYETHTTGLRSALQNERTQRSELAKQISTLSKQAAEGSDLKKSLEAMTGQLEQATQRADFFEQAAKPEIGCTNPTLAFLAARESGLIDAKGRIQWDTLKQTYPELFKQRVPAVQAGAGTQTPPAAKHTMTEYIRAAAGRG